jgi:ribosomal protein L7/L12
MNKHAIVILYSGADRDPGYDVIESIASVITQAGLAVPELIEIKHFNSDSIGKALLTKSAEDSKISFTKNLDAKKVCITLDTQDCENKLQVVKCIKEFLDCGLKEAKDMFDCGKVYIPKSWTDNRIYAFIEDLHIHKAAVTSGIEDIAMIQAAIFLNGTYRTKDSIIFVRDFAAATYHFHTNGANEEERALLTAVELVKNNPKSAVRWVSSELVNVINSL